jgi:FMN phosphatase YigB (HAD superfamily)
MRYSTVLFDLFDTLVLFDRDRLPEVRVNGKTARSTAGRLHEVLQSYVPQVDLPRFVEALLSSWQEAERIRSSTHREVSAPERFQVCVRLLGLDPSSLHPDAIEALLAAHTLELSKAAVFPEAHRELLRCLAGRYRLGIVSNFDYAPTIRLILEREGVTDLFEAVVISDTVGWRKPKPVIFEAAFSGMGIGPREALFVGDRADIDVVGAKGVGMDAAWINRGGEKLPEGLPIPEYVIGDLPELGPILGVSTT